MKSPEKVVETFEGQFSAYKAKLFQLQSLTKELNQQQQNVLHYTPSDCTFKEFDIYDVNTALHKVANNMARKLIYLAEQTFAPEGVKLSIKMEEVVSAIPSLKSTNEADNFSAEATWSYLVDTYHASGVNTALCQASKTIFSFFGLKQEAPKFKNQCLIIDRVITQDSYFLPKNGMDYRLSYNTYCHTLSFCDALHSFGSYTNNKELVEDVKYFREALAEQDRGFNSRLLMTQHKALAVTCFKGKFQYRFNQETSDALMIFLSEYSALLNAA